MEKRNAVACMAELRKIRNAAVATVDENGRPQVRMIDVMLAEGEKLYICTARGKAFYQQLMNGGQVALVAMNKQFQMFRVNGSAVRLDHQKEWIDKIFCANPAMNEVYPGNSRYVLEAFCILSGQVEFFDLGVSPIVRQTFVFGKQNKAFYGFSISDRCIGRGTCSAVCPQQCIERGAPFKIRQENCLHCGLCAEKCPVSCIERGIET